MTTEPADREAVITPPYPIDGRRWRVGTHYGIHVYRDDVPVATFHTSIDAAEAVGAHNDALRHSAERDELRDDLNTARIRLERVKAMHHVVHVGHGAVRVGSGAIPIPYGMDTECAHDCLPWPCPTIRAIGEHP